MRPVLSLGLQMARGLRYVQSNCKNGSVKLDVSLLASSIRKDDTPKLQFNYRILHRVSGIAQDGPQGLISSIELHKPRQYIAREFALLFL